MSLMRNCRKCGMALTWQEVSASKLLCGRCEKLKAAEVEGAEMDEKHHNPPNIPPAA